MLRRRRSTLFTGLLVAALVVAGAPVATSASEPPPLPTSMAAVGDSITQAANLDGSTIGSSNPEHSWSTGDDPADGIDSHYERLLAAGASIAGANHNVAVSGAKMKHAAGQADDAVATGAEYVTFLMGGNDVCASSIDAMTPVEDFEIQFVAAMDVLEQGLPEANVYVATIPDVYQLWDLFKNHRIARSVWRTFKICQSLLADSNNEEDRQKVRQRNIDYNSVLTAVCDTYARCRHDGGAVFDYQFTRNDVSSVDYFHPSKEGQANLAEVTWSTSYWSTTSDDPDDDPDDGSSGPSPPGRPF